MNPLLQVLSLPFRKGMRRWDQTHPPARCPGCGRPAGAWCPTWCPYAKDLAEEDPHGV